MKCLSTWSFTSFSMCKGVSVASGVGVLEWLGCLCEWWRYGLRKEGLVIHGGSGNLVDSVFGLKSRLLLCGVVVF